MLTSNIQVQNHQILKPYF